MLYNDSFHITHSILLVIYINSLKYKVHHCVTQFRHWDLNINPCSVVVVPLIKTTHVRCVWDKVKVLSKLLPKGWAHRVALISTSKALGQTCSTTDAGSVYCVPPPLLLLISSHCPLVSEWWVNARASAGIEPATFRSPCQYCYNSHNFLPSETEYSTYK